MQNQSEIVRQSLGCGYAPPAPTTLPVLPWAGCGYNGPPVTTCAGYTTTLPEVIEVARARLHWSKGALRDVLDAAPSPELVCGIELLEVASNATHLWAVTPAKDGGGGS